jgi:uncharacterized membrane protein YraQ (UPF0718 family)
MLKKAILKSIKSLWQSVPLIFGILLLVGLINSLFTKAVYSRIFHYGSFLNAVFGALAGSISAGSPINSYVLGGEFLKQGVSLIAVTAFLVAWVTVGLIQLPMEAKFLGIRFSLWRNSLCFLFSILAAIITVFLLKL